jgi:hypothetical protein
MLTVNKCRLCGGNFSNKIIKFQNQFVSNFVGIDEITSGIKVPIDLVVCETCTLVQQVYSAPQDFLYTQKYWYRSGVTDTMAKQLRDVVESCLSEVPLTADDVFLDIGANDGTMLSFLRNHFITVGIDPAKNLFGRLEQNCDHAFNDFWSADTFRKIQKDHKIKNPKIITAIGMFYDLEDPLSFVSDIAAILSDDGIFVAQLMTLEPMLRQRDLGNLCHEHLEFYSYSSLKYLFEKSGLEIYKITENDTNGGSYRIFSRKFSTGSIEYGEAVGLNSLKKFKDDVDTIGVQLNELMNDLSNTGKTVHALGASTKGNTILQYYELDHRKIKYASERSPEKYGLFTVGTGLEIISEEKSRKMKPDYYLVLPWAFSEEIIAREADHVMRGGKFIIPFPFLQVI